MSPGNFSVQNNDSLNELLWLLFLSQLLVIVLHQLTSSPS